MDDDGEKVEMIFVRYGGVAAIHAYMGTAPSC